jgi:cytosine/adenosine deaminase-related metal-dependent hydrolase
MAAPLTTQTIFARKSNKRFSRRAFGTEQPRFRSALRCGLLLAAAPPAWSREDIGSLEVGKVADVVLFDSDSLPCAGAEEDLLAGVVLGGVRPDTVLVGGQTVVRGGHLHGVDESALAASHNTASRRLLERWRVAGEPVR